MFAPGKIGDLSIAWFLRKRGLTYGEGLAIGVYYKMVALAVTSWLGISAIFQPGDRVELAIFILALPVGLAVVSKTMGRWIIPSCPAWRRIPGWLKNCKPSAALGTFWAICRTTAASLLLALFKSLIMTSVPWLILRAWDTPWPSLPRWLCRRSRSLPRQFRSVHQDWACANCPARFSYSKLGGVPLAAAGSMMIVAMVMQYAVAAACYGIGISGAFKPAEESK